MVDAGARQRSSGREGSRERLDFAGTKHPSYPAPRHPKEQSREGIPLEGLRCSAGGGVCGEFIRGADELLSWTCRGLYPRNQLRPVLLETAKELTSRL